MKLFFRITFKICLILAILMGCEITEEIKETDADELLNQGITFAKEGQYDQAIAYFDKAIEINPRGAEAFGSRGFAYVAKDRYDKAISDFNKAFELNAGGAELYNSRGVAFHHKGHF
jgi:Flp pilus assembly protein TadD